MVNVIFPYQNVFFRFKKLCSQTEKVWFLANVLAELIASDVNTTNCCIMGPKNSCAEMSKSFRSQKNGYTLEYDVRYAAYHMHETSAK